MRIKSQYFLNNPPALTLQSAVLCCSDCLWMRRHGCKLLFIRGGKLKLTENSPDQDRSHHCVVYYSYNCYRHHL